MPLTENKKRFAEGLGPIPKKRLEDARQLYLNALEEGDDAKKASALKTYLMTTLATYQLYSSKQPGDLLDDFKYNEKYWAVMNNDACDSIAKHFENDQENLLDMIDHEPNKLNEIFIRCGLDLGAEYDQYKFKSNTEIGLLENEAKDQQKIYDEGEKKIGAIKNFAASLIQGFNNIPMNSYKNIHNQLKMKTALENLQKFGTTDFVYTDEDNMPKHPAKEYALHPQMAIRAINGLISAATDFYDENREFALKVAGAAWKMKKEHAAYLNMDPDNYRGRTTRRLEALDDEKKARGISNKSVSPKQDYVLRSTKGMDMFRDVQRQHNAGKLSWFRGSPEYKRIGTQLSEIHRDWVDFLGTELGVNGKKPDTVTVQDHQTLKEKAHQLKQKLEALKQYNQAYYDHKIRDGQFMTGRNSNADKRIAVVDNVDKLADFLIETMARREKMADDQIKEMNKQQDLKLDLEENIIAVKDDNFDDSIDLSVIDNKLPEENDKSILGSAKELEDFFAPKENELIKENDENNIINENNIENENNIINKEDINNIIIEEKNTNEKEIILNDSSIVEEKKIIEEEKPKTAQEKAQELIDKKRTEAQQNIRKATENGKKPDENLLKESCAAIATCFFLQASISKYEKNSTVNINHLAPSSLDEKLYDTFYKNTLKSKTFKTMMKNTDSDTLISQATHEKGQNIYANYENTKKLINKPKEKVINNNNNNTIVKNNEIKNNL